MTNRSLPQQLARDNEKRRVCKEAGITLVEIPYWWDRSDLSLFATIKKYRPDLLSNIKDVNIARHVIPEEKPTTSLSDSPSSPVKLNQYDPRPKFEIPLQNWKIGEVVRFDLSQWWLSPKMKGTRAIWDGANFYSRDQGLLDSPAFFTSQFPSTTYQLDGILRSKTGNLCDFNSPSLDWSAVEFVVFDVPNIQQPYEMRMTQLCELLKPDLHHGNFIRFLEPQPCRDETHVMRCLKEALSKGNEGLILRKSASYYVHGVSDGMSRVTLTLQNEAVVENVCDSEVTIKNAQSQQFKLLYVPKEVLEKLQKGKVISYRFFALDKDGLPIYPCFSTLMEGVEWATFPSYHFSAGGAASRCRTCRDLITREKVRVLVKGSYHGGVAGSLPKFIPFTFCAKVECLEGGREPKNHARYPKFERSVRVPLNFRDALSKSSILDANWKIASERLVREGIRMFEEPLPPVQSAA
eukprot:TRINITY_DN6130_c0_g1_i2.p1 TRINITY_DN6130_c0_g1~~TRINITY_DN6130_c0_g1_i2.p1  ORF type:complete len:465 (-),score=99.86 TRINITY_DN6130_c0_g1_i2:53-1447(-)